MRSKGDSMYKNSTLLAYRHRLQIHLEKSNPDINIVKSDPFKKVAESLKSMIKEPKHQVLAVIEHHHPINDCDLGIHLFRSKIFRRYAVLTIQGVFRYNGFGI